MTIARLTRLGGLVCVVAAVLMAASNLVGVTLDASELAATTTGTPRITFTVLRLVGTVLLLPGLFGLYLRQSVAAGRLGLAGFQVAFAGTALIAGNGWLQASAGWWLLGIAPTPSVSGALTPAASVPFILFALGWLLFGLATFRARVFPRWSAVLLIVGGALGFRIGFPPYGLVLAVAVGVLGVLSYLLAGPAPQSGPTGVPTRQQVVVELDTLRPTGSSRRRAG